MDSRSDHACHTADSLYELTDGWIAGLVLVLEGLRRVPVLAADTRAPNVLHGGAALSEVQRQAVFDYFSGELFNKMDQTTCDFLLRTAVLPSMTEKMAKRLTHSQAAFCAI